MSKKDALYSQYPDQAGKDFSEEDEVLNYKPTIQYEVEQSLEREVVTRPIPSTLQEARKKIEDLRQAYQVIEKLAEIAQDRLDDRVGDYRINLNTAVDYQAKEAIKRAFPELQGEPKQISYEMYKQCLARIYAAQGASTVPVVSNSSMVAARNNPKKTNFGGLGAAAGENRKEVDSATGTGGGGMTPIDLDAFQDAIVKKLHDLMGPLDDKDHKKLIRDHLTETPHGS
jgi:hypothetical protein